MTQLTITVNGTKAGEQMFFKLNVPKDNFIKVVEMEFNSVSDVLEGEQNGLYSIS